mmetsp:Transcript_102721/g.257544  ORF Transcript_102721/g.257544 Transcript_102721/m.257544 type:complete len:225 (-) Transcript_102721:801-1475(-)
MSTNYTLPAKYQRHGVVVGTTSRHASLTLLEQSGCTSARRHGGACNHICLQLIFALQLCTRIACDSVDGRGGIAESTRRLPAPVRGRRRLAVLVATQAPCCNSPGSVAHFLASIAAAAATRMPLVAVRILCGAGGGAAVEHTAAPAAGTSHAVVTALGGSDGQASGGAPSPLAAVATSTVLGKVADKDHACWAISSTERRRPGTTSSICWRRSAASSDTCPGML